MMLLLLWRIAAAAALLAGTVGAQRTLTTGVECDFPFVFDGEEVFDCVDLGGSDWCIGVDGFWGICAEADETTAPAAIQPARDDPPDSSVPGQTAGPEPFGSVPPPSIASEGAISPPTPPESAIEASAAVTSSPVSLPPVGNRTPTAPSRDTPSAATTVGSRPDPSAPPAAVSLPPPSTAPPAVSPPPQSAAPTQPRRRAGVGSMTNANGTLAASLSDGQPCCDLLAEIGFTSNLPVIILDTQGSEIVDEPKIPGIVCTCGSPGEDINELMGIEIRGSTSAREFEKKSFSLETRDEAGEDLDVSFVGLPEDSDWILYGPEMDKTMGMRNYVSMNLFRAAGRYASNTVYVEVFLWQDAEPFSLDHYNGVYIAMEKIKRDKNRIDIQKNEDDDISSSYIFKYDNDNIDEGDKIITSPSSGLQFVSIYPKKNDITQAQLDWIGGYIGDFEAALATLERENWLPFIDEDSFVDFFLMVEVTKSPDGYRGSVYFNKDKDGLLVAGPPWDYNEAYGFCCGFPFEGYLDNGVSDGISGGSAISPEGWRFNICADEQRCLVDPLDGVSPWYRALVEDRAFLNKVLSRWSTLREGVWSNENVIALMQELVPQIQDAVLRNYERWRKTLDGGNQRKNLEIWTSEVSNMENWLIDHLNWIDSQLLDTS